MATLQAFVVMDFQSFEDCASLDPLGYFPIYGSYERAKEDYPEVNIFPVLIEAIEIIPQ